MEATSDSDCSDVDSEQDQEHDEDTREPTSWTGISYQGDDSEKYLVGADLMSENLSNASDHIAVHMSFTNKPLFRAFFYFYCLLVVVQPDVLVPKETWDRVESGLERAPSLHRAIVSHAPLLGRQPRLGAALRSRACCAVSIYRRIFRSAPATEARLAAWLSCDCMLRYTGTSKFIEDTAMRDPRAALRHLCDGVTPDTSEAVAGFFRAPVLGKLHLMSSVTGWFDRRGGRRRTYPRSFGVPIVCNFRIMDHLLHALPGWIASCLAIAGQLSSLNRVVKMARAGEDDPGLVKRAFAVTEALVLSLLTLVLLGRPAVSPSLPFASRVHCYPLKFMLSDIFLLVGCAVCSRAGRPADAAGMPDGSPLAVETALPKLRQLNECINEYFGSSFCLYRAAFGPSRRRDRRLPCTWRLFLTRARSKSKVPPDALADCEWRSRCRVLAEATMAAEAALMTNMFGWLARHGLFSEYESHPGVGPLMPRIKLAVAALVAGGVLKEAPGADQGFVEVGYLEQSEEQAAFRHSLGVSVEARPLPPPEVGPPASQAARPKRGPRAPAHPRKARAPRAALPELGPRDAAALDAALARRGSARSGLAGKLRGEEVVVLDAFVCRGRLRCDVAPVVQGSGAGPAGGAHVLRTSLRRGLATCAGSDLADVQHRWRCVSIVRGVPWMARVPESAPDGGRAASVAPRALVEDAQMLQSFRRALAGMNVAAPACQRPAAPALVTPKAADDRARQFQHRVARQQGEAALQPSGECRRGSYVWDFPWPVQLDRQRWVCFTCRAVHEHGRCPQASCGGRGDDVGHRRYFPATDEDAVRVAPDAIVIRGNAAEGGQKEGRCYVTGRFLARFLFCLNDTLNFRECRRQLLGEHVAVARGAEAGLSDADARAVLFNIAFALPKRKMLGMIALRAFSAPISRRVSEMRRLRSAYNGSGLRVDGNFKLAKKIWRGAGKARQKPFSCVLGICGTDGSPLQPVAPVRGGAWMDIKRVLQPLLADIVSARQAAGMSLEDACTAFVSTYSYSKHFKKYADVVDEACQLARVRTAGATPRGPLAARGIVAPSVGVLVAGEPFHDVLNARRCVNPQANDSSDPVGFAASAAPRSRLEALAQDPDGARDLRAFLSSPGVLRAKGVWKSAFGAQPPRPVLAREVRGRRCVFNSKLRRHCSRLLKSRRLSGLLAWQECAEGLRAAGVDPRSGTVPVEQSWAIAASHCSALPAWVDDDVMYFQQSERARLMLEPETALRLEQELADAARQIPCPSCKPPARVALAYRGHYHRQVWSKHGAKNGRLICSDFFSNVDTHREMLVGPLEAAGAIVKTYFHTYQSEDDALLSQQRDDRLVRVLRPDKKSIDAVVLTRFDLKLREPITLANVRWNVTNAAHKEGEDSWKREKRLSDLFFILPIEHVEAFIQ
ncbi:unnamed protein product, partial [Prorocentrum cordatum]